MYPHQDHTHRHHHRPMPTHAIQIAPMYSKIVTLPIISHSCPPKTHGHGWIWAWVWAPNVGLWWLAHHNKGNKVHPLHHHHGEETRSNNLITLLELEWHGLCTRSHLMCFGEGQLGQCNDKLTSMVTWGAVVGPSLELRLGWATT